MVFSSEKNEDIKLVINNTEIEKNHLVSILAFILMMN